MSKQVDGMRRMLLIMGKVETAGRAVPRPELLSHVNTAMEGRGYGKVSARTMERDIQDIGELFHVYISFDRGRRGYVVKENLSSVEERLQELMMNFDLLNALSEDSNLSSFVLAEHHRPKYSKWITPLIRAIQESHPVGFDYVNYRDDCNVRHYCVLPHYLKESNQRWYLLAYDGATMKTFGIDRIRNLDIREGETFERNMNIDVAELFADCYGIWDDERIPVEDIELRYDALDGRFIKSAPIHHSQRILADNDNELRIALRLRITNDFVMELLSRSRSLEVIRPRHLRERIRKFYEEALRRNS